MQQFEKLSPICNILFLSFSKRIMESLNLLRYLVIRDKVTENRVSQTTVQYLSKSSAL